LIAWKKAFMTESFTDVASPLYPTSPGALIKAAREKAGIHLAILSVNLKVSVKQLEALEADQFDQLSEPVFARALAAKVCRLIKLDPNPVLALMPMMTNGLKPLNVIDTTGQASFDEQRSTHQRVFRGGRVKLWVLLIFVLGLLFAMNNQWSNNMLFFNASSDLAEVVPAMPPVQEAVVPESAQNELPKAMVFESATSTSNTPTPASTESVPTEVRK
jgi:cytoskeleton protein RodZ